MRRVKGGRTEVEVVQRSEEEQGRKDRGGGGAESVEEQRRDDRGGGGAEE